jgi:hypothetical protein
MEVMMGNTLLGKRMKDLRTVLAYLRTRKELDPDRIGLWGDSFTPVNPARVLLDELPQWRVGPEIQYEAEPLGGLLAIMGALYEPNVRAVTIRRGLVSYMSMLEDQFTYVPSDVAVPGILEVGDFADLASAMAPRPLLLEGLVDGRDRAVPAAVLRQQLEPIFESYRQTSPANLTVHENATGSGVAEWFRAHL